MNLPTETVVIENISPCIDGGRYMIKRVEGDDIVVEADVFKDGHDVVRALLKWRRIGETGWKETAMKPLVNDRWRGVFTLLEAGDYEYTIEAWGDAFASWQAEYRKKHDAGWQDLTSEILEGAAIVRAAVGRCHNSRDVEALEAFAQQLERSTQDKELARRIAESSDLAALMESWPDRSLATEYKPALRVRVERRRALFASWYEFFPRSAEGKPDSGSTFRDCLGRIDDAKAMGFDVIYFPPIHPIGETNRKGPNNSLKCSPGDPGVPYAIGNYRQGVNGGGHRDVAPELGTLEDFEWLVGEIRKRGMELALDFAINCSPDHPYVREHPEWFYKRPDGTIKYAENPPKKYEDVYPLNFHNPNWKELWIELRDVLLFWAERGVRIFRVDNPHTKPVAFWEWVIEEVHRKYPDVIFLSEAFTRPKMMKVLAKVGFSQSYTYFTWRNTKYELTEYFTELTKTEMAEYFRPHLFTNTPDILPFFLQHGGRPAFLIRAVLAATLSPLWGIYSGFELCENQGIEGKEEYLNSEKYQFKGRDWNAPGNIKDFIARLNRIRRENRALQLLRNLEFHPCDNEQILFYSKVTPAKDNILLIIVSLDPWHSQSGFVEVPIGNFGFLERETYQAEDLLTGERYLWSGSRNYVALNPHDRPAHILRIRRWTGREETFDYFQ
ncbi:MAG: alpha-1,4-glucan--maltose-1-phosphate maltosyltransferase [Chthoniobacterales bacterium]|nr:alpha-1,4-glucan--maltose-1-phosphate maltosyltransferase [Chthoniobacterales bacterium]